MFLVSILTALDADALVALFPSNRHAIGSKLLRFLVIECLFEEISGILSLYTSTQLQQAVVAKLAERFLGSSSQDNTAQLRARRASNVSMSNKQVRHILGLSGGKDTALAILMHKQVPQMEYFFCDTHKELPETYEYLDRIKARLGIKLNTSAPTGLITGCLW